LGVGQGVKGRVWKEGFSQGGAYGIIFGWGVGVGASPVSKLVRALPEGSICAKSEKD